MLDLLSSWAEAAPAGVKLCVSSREYEVSHTAFCDHERLRLQVLTCKDIESLGGFEISGVNGVSVANKNRLVKEIVERADGIFLWVALVLKSLRDGLQYDNRLSSL